MKESRILKRVGCACAIFAVALSASGQTVYPPTVIVPVTYFDFHSDGSNPDFNPGTNPALVLPGMVLDTLDADGLPVGNSNAILYSWGIGKWWRSWPQSQTPCNYGNDFQRPLYGPAGRTVASVNTVTYDTSYKNVVIQDSLVFTYVPGSAGGYQYQNSNFFPLDGRGFGADVPTISFNGMPLDRTMNTHNYSFAMHFKINFQYETGQTFAFEGDDDMWVFINGQLALDLGGIHATVIGNFSLDAIASGQGLVPGASSTIDVFYCERQAVGSDIKITTNIITRPPGPQLVPVSSFTTDTLPVFSWHPLPNQAPYTIQIDTTSSFTTPMITVAVSDTFFKPLVNLPFDTIYWRVKGDSTAFSTGSFIIYLDTVPELVRFNGATISESRPVFTWHPVVNALYYDFDIADNPSFTNKTSALVAAISYTPLANLTDGLWYWHVSCNRNYALFAPYDSVDIAATGAKAVRAKAVAPFVKMTASRAFCSIVFGGYNKGEVSAVVYSINGKRVSQFVNSARGNGSFFWNYSDLRGNRVSNGLYLIEIRAGEKLIRQKVLVTK